MACSAAFRSLLLICVLGSFISASSAQTCKSQNFTNKVFQTCIDLPVLNAFLHWNYFPSNGTVGIAYRATPAVTDGWVAWAVNPTGTGMVGSQAIVGYVVSSKINVITTSLTSLGPSMQNESLSFPVSNLAGETSGNDIIVFATLSLPKKNSTVNMVWQNGPMSGGIPGIHALTGANIVSTKTLDLSGQSTKTTGSNPSPSPSLSNPSSSPSLSPNTTGSSPSPSPPQSSSGGVSKMRGKNMTFLADSFVFDLFVLLSAFVFYLI